MANPRPDLDRLRVVRYDPIVPEGWNALRGAILGLYDGVAALAAHVPSALYVTVRDAVTGDPVPEAWIEAVSAAPSERPDVPLPPGVPLQGRYLIARPEPGRYVVTVEPRPTTGYAVATTEVTVAAGTPASVDLELVRVVDQRVIPDLFGVSFALVRDRLAALQLVVGQVMDAHGHVFAPDAWLHWDSQPVVSTEPGAGVVVPIGQAVDVLLAAVPVPHFPNLLGLTEADARASVESFGQTHGLTIEHTEWLTQERPDGANTVVTQVPMAAAEVFGQSLTVRVVIGIPQPVKVAVPDLANLTPAEAQMALEGVGLTLDAPPGDQPTDQLAQDGHVASQEPLAGASVLLGSMVRVILWRFPRVVVPDVANLAQAAAATTLADAGLVLAAPPGEQATADLAQDGRVATQDPVAGTSLLRGSTVHVTVWRFPRVIVPDLANLTPPDAQAALTAAGLVLEAVTGVQPTDQLALDGNVATQDPAPGASVLWGSAVCVTLWRFPRVTVPDLSALTQTEADTALTNAGLGLNPAVGALPTDQLARDGRVATQDPAAGASVLRGSTVRITLWRFPRVSVPDLISLTPAEAGVTLANVGLMLDPQTNQNPTDQLARDGRIASQDPIAGSSVPQGSSVRIFVWLYPRVSVPDLSNLTQAEANLALSSAGLLLDVAMGTQPTDQPARDGRVASQDPAAGSRVPQGSSVRVDLWRFPRATVPDLTNLTQAEAGAALANAGLLLDPALGQQSTDQVAQDGRVASQAPAAASVVFRGSRVRVVLWRLSGVLVPALQSQTVAAAQAALNALGLGMQTQALPVLDASQAGLIVAQDPVADTRVAIGSVVNLTVAVLARMPELRCGTLAEAQVRVDKFAQEFGIKWPGQLTVNAWPSERERDTVIDQQPAPATLSGPELAGVTVVVRRPPFPDVRCLQMDQDRVIDLLKAWADQNGVNLTDVRVRPQASDRAPGTVLTQKPAALSADYDPQATVVNLIVADKRPEPLRRFPELTCLDQNRAQEVLLAFQQKFQLELKLALRDLPSQRPEGTVLEQSPRPDAQVQSGDVVTLGLARAPLPDVLCMDVDRAHAQIIVATKGRQLLWNEAKAPSELAPGTVVQQSPMPGTPIPAVEQRIAVTATLSGGM